MRRLLLKRTGILVALAAAIILSTLVSTSSAWAASGDFIISGRGYGHGVGMSQWGAWAAARAGQTYDQILAFYYPGTALTQVSSEQTLKVRLTKSSNSSWSYYRVDLRPAVTSATLVMHDSEGDHTESIEAGSAVQTRFVGGKVEVTGVTGAFDWEELRPESTDGRVRLSLYATSSTTSASTYEYWGTGRVEPYASSASLRLYNIVLLDRYTRGVSEIDPGWANESLPSQYAPECVKAQQTAARTYALAEGSSELYDNTSDQVYGGYTYEVSHPGVAAAADATAGMVITYDGELITAFFCSHSGGYLTNTAWSDDPGIPYLVSKPDPWSLAAPMPPWTISPGYPWTYTFSPATLASKLRVSVGTITCVEVIARDTSDPESHARTMRITGTTGSTTMSARTFKSRLGLKSTLILSITGGPETFPGAVRFDDKDTHLVYAGTWYDFPKTSAWAGSYARTDGEDASVSIHFNGTRLDWIAMMGTTTGIADVYLDGTFKATVDLSATVATYQVDVWSTGDISAGQHVVTIERNSESPAGKFITIDAVDLAGTLTGPPPPPAVTGLDPISGSTAGGTSVTITGTGFTDVTSVSFGGDEATDVVAGGSGTEISCTAPAHSEGTVDVQVTTAAGSSENTAADDFTYLVPATRYEQSDGRIVKVGNWTDFYRTAASDGSYGRANSGDASATVYFNGTRLDWIAMKGTTPGLADVYLDGVKKTTIDLTAPTAVYDVLVWSTGPVSEGPHKVEIRRSTLNTGSEYVTLDAVDVVGVLTAAPVPPPAVAGLDPISGSTAGGTSVTITGTGFINVTSVILGDSAAVDFTVDSPTQITAVAPAHDAGKVDVKVTTAVGPSENTAADDYTYVEPPQSARYEQTDTHIKKTGAWYDYDKTAASAGSYGRSSTIGASATVYFNGTRLDWIAMKGTTTGIAEVYVDGVWKARVDLRATTASYQVMVFSTGTLPSGNHSFKVVRSPVCPAGKYVTLDAVDVWGGTLVSPPAHYEQTDTRIAKVGSWINFTKAAASGGSYGRSLTSTPAQASATISFTGTRLDYIGMKGTTAGVADVYLDGDKVATINLNASTATYDVLVWSSGTLPEGTHTVRIVRNADSGTTRYLTLDAVDIWGTIKTPA